MPAVRAALSFLQVCDDYRLSTQTAWTAVHYFDRYMSARGNTPIDRDEAELISLTCVFLAAKYHFQHILHFLGRRLLGPYLAVRARGVLAEAS